MEFQHQHTQDHATDVRTGSQSAPSSLHSSQIHENLEEAFGTGGRLGGRFLRPAASNGPPPACNKFCMRCAPPQAWYPSSDCVFSGTEVQTDFKLKAVDVIRRISLSCEKNDLGPFCKSVPDYKRAAARMGWRLNLQNPFAYARHLTYARHLAPFAAASSSLRGTPRSSMREVGRGPTRPPPPLIN